MELHDHEKWIKDNLGNTRVPLDTSKLWSELKPYAPIQNKKKKYGLFFLFGSILGVLILLVYSFDGLKKPVDQNNFDKNNTVSTAMLTDNIKDEPIISTKSTHENSNESVIKPQYDTPSTTTSVDQSKKNPHITKNVNYKRDEINNNFILLNQYNSQSNISSAEQNLSNPDNSANKNPIKAESKTSKFIAYNLGNHVIQTLFPEPIKINTLPTLELRSDLKKKASVNSIFFISGINYNQNRIISENEEFKEVYPSVVTPIPGFYFNIGLSKKILNRLNLSVSLDYNNAITKFDHTYSTIEESTELDINKIVINIDGQSESESGEVKTFKETRYSGIWYQNNQSFSIKTGAEVNLLSSPRLQFDIGLGIRHQLLNKLSGYAMTKSLSLNNAEAIDYKSFQYIPGLYYNLNLDYRITPKTRIFIQTEIQKQHTIFNEYDLDYTIYRLGLGCRYKI